MKVIIRTDASLLIGSGHVMRCLALAEALQRNNINVEFICRNFSGNLIQWIKKHGFAVHILPQGGAEVRDDDPEYHPLLESNWNQDAVQTFLILEKSDCKTDWLIVDHYALDWRWEKHLRKIVRKIMVIDDLADRHHDCDLLLDQNFYLKKDRYKKLVSKSCNLLMGPRYALIREEFSLVRKHHVKTNSKVRRIFVFFGGVDPTNETGKILRILGILNIKDIQVDIVLGPANPHLDLLKKATDSLEYVHLNTQVENMAQLMAEADVAIGAGGTTNWERICLGLPTLIIPIAENQVQVCRDLAAEGYLILAERCSATKLQSYLEVFLSNKYLLKYLAQKSQQLVDGKGTQRVLKQIIEPRIILCPAQSHDRGKIFGWRNNFETRKHFFDPTPISWEEHANWFQKVLVDRSRHLLIGKYAGQPVGILRYDLDATYAKVSIYMVQGNKGQGLGTALLKAGTAWIQKNETQIQKIKAEILDCNKASIAAFMKAGFKNKYYSLERTVE